ncbi:MULTISPECIES: hypothetical protein [Halorussus]|uniref:hypothetical protein n=1 Tax=Halorussus TaxID=1070314 RepID=UPI000E218A55|nr:MULTISPECIES: hypothetical protein [Halorussus]NHN59817.1 hypothetical protein [Halorussus sp. JP-T4]
MNRETYAHLVGYSTLALILGTASWSTFGWVFALPLVLGTLALVGRAGSSLVIEKARIDDEPLDLSPDQSPKAATDGGRTTRLSPAEVADAVREHGAENVQDDAIAWAIEQGGLNAGGGRNRRHTTSERN